jgi:hypothetical protein
MNEFRKRNQSLEDMLTVIRINGFNKDAINTVGVREASI